MSRTLDDEVGVTQMEVVRPWYRRLDRTNRCTLRPALGASRPIGARPNTTGVILIDPSRSPGREEEFSKLWDAAAEYMARQPGFRWTRLHQAVTPNPRYAFVNVAEMESPEQFLAAISTDEFAASTAPMKDFPAAPTLYRVVREASA